MDPVELIRAGQLDDAVVALTDLVRRKPADADARMFLYQLFAFKGQWDRALRQLNIAAEMSQHYQLLGECYRPLLACEALREKVFAGAATPVIFGEPPKWAGQLVQALASDAGQEFESADRLRAEAFEAAETFSGHVDSSQFAWIADVDPRLGPMTEAVIEGTYYWLPLERLSRVSIPEPTDLRDFLWLPCFFTFTNGGTTPAFVPTRYVGTQTLGDPLTALARKTDWYVARPGLEVPAGQRMFVTDSGEYAAMDIREMSLAPMVVEEPDANEPGAPEATA